jgi:hypothetical protein
MGEHVRREGGTGLFAGVDHRSRPGDSTHAREVDPDDVDGLADEQRLRVVAPALFVAHGDRRTAGALAKTAHDLRIPRWEDVLEPAEACVADRVQERHGVVDGTEDPGRIHAQPCLIAGRLAGGEQTLRAVFERKGDRDLESSPAVAAQAGDLGTHRVGGHRGRRVADDRRRRHAPRLTAEIARDRHPRAAGEQVVNGEIDDRQRAQPDPAAQPGEVRTLAAIERGCGVRRRFERGADVVVRDRLADRRVHRSLARECEGKALGAAGRGQADDRKAPVAHDPIAEEDRLRQRRAHGGDTQITDRLSGHRAPANSQALVVGRT